ncbi:ABC-2 type transport system permease protein [Tamaricihabitans halophyticus]|uniref:ABC-2 type transport system permease protein n=1 Tax=Tamaricihabitans halophyticus TaxID=1262583 RepID=A0A4R2R459_9PSEU|nr:hypothetical protein [Tamaricihabitans halophyticus]TCP57363.1 ABC-2 type transport system permease protein [Tamaricihabitans halophyticus]
MTLLAVERIKLFSTRSPWACIAIALVTALGFSALVVGTVPEDFEFGIGMTQVGIEFGLAIIMVLGALAITTEYRFNTIRTSFQAVPNRSSLLLAKTAVVSLVAAVVGLVAAFGAWGLGYLIDPGPHLALNTAADWRNVAGASLIFGLAAAIAVSVGVLIRHTAGATALVLLYSQVLEPMVQLIPNIGADIHQWMPFNVARNFLAGGAERPAAAAGGPPEPIAALSPWWSLAYFAAFAAVILTAALVTAKRRDA